MYLHAICACTLLCPDLEAQIRAYEAIGFTVLSHAPLASERALDLGLSGHFASARLSLQGASNVDLELVETAQGYQCNWSTLELSVAGMTEVNLAHAGFELLAKTAGKLTVRGPAGERLQLTDANEADNEPVPTVCAQLRSETPNLSAAFYLGLGAAASIPTASGAQTAVALSSGSRLQFCASPDASVSSGFGIYMLTLARRGTRGQPGPARILRGLDQELIELI